MQFTVLLYFLTLVAARAALSNLQANIHNVVILVMENRSLDNLFGGQRIEGLENPINHGPFCNPYNLSDTASGAACSAASDYDSVINDPDHAVYGNNLEFYGTFTQTTPPSAGGALVPNQKGFVHEQLRLYNTKANQSVLATQVMNYYTEKQVPVLTSLVQNFMTFNH